MSQVQEKAVGGALFGIGFFVFTYYSIWTLLVPFIDKDHFLRSLFPSQWYAIAIPVFLLVVGCAGIFGFISMVMIKSNKKDTSKKSS
ncbi:Dolichol phosphate-mannose biosynthesis regulatory protein [Smittium culicis]|uniref:Dolichol phosphate-mannose biosynthesis regulatory protein n=1 Tax=Smittium culicis TaxID=133412 RepID=A0A1R1WYN0_9FUNG|nr:Dolichol phosphate-mannose biosynthesis regulatory protein [Smittium culicis]